MLIDKRNFDARNISGVDWKNMSVAEKKSALLDSMRHTEGVFFSPKTLEHQHIKELIDEGKIYIKNNRLYKAAATLAAGGHVAKYYLQAWIADNTGDYKIDHFASGYSGNDKDKAIEKAKRINGGFSHHNITSHVVIQEDHIPILNVEGDQVSMEPSRPMADGGNMGEGTRYVAIRPGLGAWFTFDADSDAEAQSKIDRYEQENQSELHGAKVTFKKITEAEAKEINVNYRKEMADGGNVSSGETHDRIRQQIEATKKDQDDQLNAFRVRVKSTEAYKEIKSQRVRDDITEGYGSGILKAIYQTYNRIVRDINNGHERKAAIAQQKHTGTLGVAAWEIIDELVFHTPMEMVSEGMKNIYLTVDGEPTTLYEFLSANNLDPDVEPLTPDQVDELKSLKVGETMTIHVSKIERVTAPKMAAGGDIPAVVENPKSALEYAEDKKLQLDLFKKLNAAIGAAKKEKEKNKKRIQSKNLKIQIPALNKSYDLDQEIYRLDNDERAQILGITAWDGYNITRRSDGTEYRVYDIQTMNDEKEVDAFIAQENKGVKLAKGGDTGERQMRIDEQPAMSLTEFKKTEDYSELSDADKDRIGRLSRGQGLLANGHLYTHVQPTLEEYKGLKAGQILHYKDAPDFILLRIEEDYYGEGKHRFVTRQVKGKQEYSDDYAGVIEDMVEKKAKGGKIDHDLEIGDEGMYHGGEYRVNGFDKKGNVEIVELDGEGNEVGKIQTVSIESLMPFPRFPKKKMAAGGDIEKKRWFIKVYGDDGEKNIGGPYNYAEVETHVEKLQRDNEEFSVFDPETGEEITRKVKRRRFADGGDTDKNILPDGEFQVQFIPYHENSKLPPKRATAKPVMSIDEIIGYKIFDGVTGEKIGYLHKQKLIDFVKSGEYTIIKPKERAKSVPKVNKDKYTIKGNQYLPNGFGRPASTYYYIVDNEGKTYHHRDGKWRKKELIEMTTYAYYSHESAQNDVDKLIAGETPIHKDAGGPVTFKEKQTAIAKNLEGKKVKPGYQRKYGKKYTAASALRAAGRIAGSMVNSTRKKPSKKY